MSQLPEYLQSNRELFQQLSFYRYVIRQDKKTIVTRLLSYIELFLFSDSTNIEY
jgi:hypothetical protein